MAALVEAEKKANKQESLVAQAAITYGYIFLWIFLSATVILLNKYVLAYAAFPFPIALTLTHMGFCAGLAATLVHVGVCDTPCMETQQYLRTIVPIAALFSGTLWLGNAAYMYLSVSFIQMLKASMPVTVFIVGVFLGTEKYSHIVAINLAVVSVGVAAASYGELAFNLLGVICQAGSIATESFRLALIQILLQSRGIKLNPITTLYYVAPACFGFLLIPFSILELPLMVKDTAWQLSPLLLLVSACAAFALNVSVFLLIGRTSALTMNVAGVLKDWLLIGLSIMIFRSTVTSLQFGGYSIAFAGVCWFNYQKLQTMKAASAVSQSQSEENGALLGEEGSAKDQSR